MPDLILGIDTSCYTTSAALVTADGEILASARRLLDVAQGERGLRQSEGVYQHVRRLPEIIRQAMEAAGGSRLAAVCASMAPRDGEDSFMPVFRVGYGTAVSIAAAAGIPCYGTSHQRGHVAAAGVGSGIGPGPTLAVHLSGGTTEVLRVTDEALTLLGGTLDLHAGQLVDRTGVQMGMPFPAGPSLERLALTGESRALIPVSMDREGMYCHLSGAEAQVQRWLRDGGMRREDIAREVFDFLARTVSRMILAAADQSGIGQVLVAGGVASSPLLREMLTARVHKKRADFRVCFGKPEYSGDNAVGTALIGARRYREEA